MAAKKRATKKRPARSRRVADFRPVSCARCGSTVPTKPPWEQNSTPFPDAAHTPWSEADEARAAAASTRAQELLRWLATVSDSISGDGGNAMWSLVLDAEAGRSAHKLTAVAERARREAAISAIDRLHETMLGVRGGNRDNAVAIALVLALNSVVSRGDGTHDILVAAFGRWHRDFAAKLTPAMSRPLIDAWTKYMRDPDSKPRWVEHLRAALRSIGVATQSDDAVRKAVADVLPRRRHA